MSRHLLGMALVDVVTQRQHTVHAVLDPRLGVPELIKRAIAFLAEHKAMAGGLLLLLQRRGVHASTTGSRPPCSLPPPSDVLLGKVSEAEVLEIQTEWMTSRTLTIAPGLHKDVQLMGGTARR